VARAGCATAEIRIRSSILVGADPFSGPGTITTAFSAHQEDPDAPGAESRIDGDPKLGADGRPASDSPAIDRADPVALRTGEPFEDLAGTPRIADGDGDGTLRRDAGAYELQPQPVPLPGGNVLANPGAEDGLTGWAGTFEAMGYGTPSFPTTSAALALGAGAAFFAGGTGAAPTLTQRIDVAGAARAIDGGGAGAVLSGLLGGYGADEDGIGLSATFLDPEGRAIGSLSVQAVTPRDRANVTNLLFRSAAGAIPARTRAIDVVIAGKHEGGDYTDAYADNVGLVLSVPGVPVDPPVKPGPVVPNLRPFAGVTVLHARTKVTRTGLTRVALACASATVRDCRGTLDLRAVLPRRTAPSRIARVVTFAVGPGGRRGVFLRLDGAVRRALRGHRSIRATLTAVAADGQGVQRTRTVPIRLLLPATRPAARR
jgi:hypothetical protein